MSVSYAKIASTSVSASASAPAKTTVPQSKTETPKGPRVPANKIVEETEPVPVAPKVTEPSICIPRVPKGFSDGVVIQCIEQMGYGEVEKIDMVPRTDKNGEDFTMAFIHMADWNMEGPAVEDRKSLLEGEKIKIVYDEADNKYFQVRMSYSDRPGQNKTKGKRHTKKSETFVDNDGFTCPASNTPNKKWKNHQPAKTALPAEPKKSTNITKRNVLNSFAQLGLDMDSD
jgi:hypothetical protein